MKARVFYLFLIAVAIGCNKSDDATPGNTPGCRVMFKGTTYTFSTAFCHGGTATEPTIDGLTVTENNKSFIILRDSADPTRNGLVLSLDLTQANTYAAGEGITSQPTITRSGNNWTFSGTATNGTDSGAISGNCTCTN